ncbi:glycerate kinase family protein [Actinomycetota bacterium]
MRVLIAPDCFTGTLTAGQAAEAMAQGWLAAAPHDDVVAQPMSDGGPGFLDVLASALDGQTLSVTVSDPLGRQVPAGVLMVGQGSERTAYLESAQAAGLHLLADHERDPGVTVTTGVGQLVEAALEEGARRIVIGLGGSGTNDAGMGALSALGVGPAERLGQGGLALADLTPDDLPGLARARERLSDVELLVATDVEAPLLGLHGASYGFGPQKGATQRGAQDLERALGHLTDVVARTLPPQTDLLTGRPRRLDTTPGTGAAGGLGYGLMLLGGRRVSGVTAVMEAVGLTDGIRGADLVVTGEGTFDWQSLTGKVVSGVAETATAAAVPSIVIAGQALVGRREAMSVGLAGVYAVAETPEQVQAALADPVGTLAARTGRVARTWSPGR